MTCATPEGSRAAAVGASQRAARIFHGVSVPEPHRWLEDASDARVRAWAEEQDRLAGDYLTRCAELGRCRAFLERNLQGLDPTWRCERPGRSFRMVRRAGLAQPVLSVTEAGGEERTLVDPNLQGRTLNPDYPCVSPSGRYVAYTLSGEGEIPGTLHVCDSATGRELDRSRCLTAVPMFAWLPDESGFFYSLFRRFFDDDGSGDSRGDGVYRHDLGGTWGDDPCIRASDEASRQMDFAVVPDLPDCLLIGTHHFSSHCSGFSLHRLSAPKAQGTTLFGDSDYNEYLGSARGELFFHTSEQAPLGRIVAIAPQEPSRVREVLRDPPLPLARPERFPGPARCAVGERELLVSFIEHAHHVLGLVDLDGLLRDRFLLPVPCTVDSVEPVTGGFRILAQSFLIPRMEYRYDGATRRLVETSRRSLPQFDAEPYEMRQVFYPASDGVKVPLYLLHKHDLPLHGNHPTLLYGYGGFGMAITPEYMPDAALWLELGGVFAVANIRGGGEYGEAWHAAGSGPNKQVGFDDFYAAADYLIATGYCGAGTLAARGISNGGLLTAVCANQRPELFAALVSEIPLTDLLWLNETAAGQSLAAEYGNPFESRSTFDRLRAYSPAHNARGDGPAQLVVVAERDFSAPPGQAFKFVAARQEALEEAGRDTPVLLRLVRGEGHGGWRPESTCRVLAEEVAFLWHVLHGDARAPDLPDANVSMRDGVRLSANVWLPARAERSPAVLLRTAYDQDRAAFARYGLQDYLAAGFAVVFESVRGRGKSQGKFGFFFVEGDDGYDSVEWVAAQPWCDGRVAMDGGSYLGTAQWLAARASPPHLACIMPAVPAGDWFNEIPYMGGALQVDWAFSWLGMMGGLAFDFDAAGARNLERYRPLISAEKILGAELPLYREVVSHPPGDAYWKPLEFTADDFARITVPVFTVTGWFDGDQAGTLRYWSGMQQLSPPPGDLHLVIGPWGHRACYLGGEGRIGEMDFGAQSVLPIRKLRLDFLRRHLGDGGRDPPPRVRLFVTGSNRWHEFDRYPPERSRPRAWFLCSNGQANGLKGDGRLCESQSPGLADRYRYDPLDPVHYKPGGEDHSDLERRDDVLVYTSHELQQPLTVIGAVETILYAASSALDTDFTAKLLDVYPDGRALSLTHVGGVLRARYRNGFARPEPLTPHEASELRIRLSHVGHTFLTGHRLRLEVSSSCFPLVDPNTNTGRDFSTDTEHQVAEQAIYHDAHRPSRLLLPVCHEV